MLQRRMNHRVCDLMLPAVICINFYLFIMQLCISNEGKNQNLHILEMKYLPCCDS